ncbi:MAG: creatininase family protein [Nannocystaceae bacterium]
MPRSTAPSTRPSAGYALSDLTYAEVEAILASDTRRVALLPVGSTEAHGPHLPLATDSIIAEGMTNSALAVLAARGYTAIAFPALHYAVTDWAGTFAGSTSLPAATSTALIRDTAISAKRMGFDRVVLVNAHLEPAHLTTLRDAARSYADAIGEPLLFPDKTRRRVAEQLTDEFKSGSCHAGQYETSIVLALRPDLVKTEIAAKLPDHVVALHEHIQRGAQNFEDCGLDQAYCGAPRKASAKEGHATLALLARVIADAVDQSFA